MLPIENKIDHEELIDALKSHPKYGGHFEWLFENGFEQHLFLPGLFADDLPDEFWQDFELSFRKAENQDKWLFEKWSFKVHYQKGAFIGEIEELKMDGTWTEEIIPQ